MPGKSLRHLLCLFFVYLGTLSSVNAAQPLASQNWQEAPPLPYRIQEIYPAVFANHIIVAGGLGPDTGVEGIGVSDRVVMYSLDTQKWSDGPALPEPRHHPMLVVVGNRLLSFGGFVRDKHGMWHNSTDVLELVVSGTPNAQSIANGKWHYIANMPAPLAETLSAVNNGKVHLVTGRTPKVASQNSQWNDQTDVNTHFIFDPVSSEWSSGAAVPTARNSACSVTFEGSLHTIAGRTVADGNLAAHEAYDFTTQQWRKLSPLPEAQGGLACAVAKGRIYVFGGEYFDNGGGVYAKVWEYSSESDNWRQISTMPDPRHGLGALAIADSIYVIAGASQAGGNQTRSAMDIFTPTH